MDNEGRVEKAVLLGLVPLLGATRDLATALAAAAIAAAAALIVGLASLALRRTAPVVRWSVIVSVSFATGWVLSSVAAYVVPVPAGSLLFLRLVAVTPIVFLPSARVRAGAESGAFADAAATIGVFLLLLVSFGAVRELLGRGTVLGFLATREYTTPAGVFATPIGAFLLAGGVVLGARRVGGGGGGR